MRKIGKIIGCCLIAVSLLACTACSGLDRLGENLKDGAEQNECREIVIRYQLDSLDGNCQLIYISPDLEEQVLSESASGSVAVQLQAGANYIGIIGTDFSGTIQITVE